MEGRPRCGEGDAEFGPAVGVVGGVGMSAVGGGEGGDDGQAEAAAATAAGGVGAGESVEGDGKKVVGESGAVVADADVDCTVAGVRGDSDFTVPVGDGVVEHGGEDSAQVVRIDRDEQVRVRALSLINL